MSIFDITGILARKTRRPTGHFSDLRKAYPIYFDPSESNGEVNFSNNNHITSNFINKVLNFKLKLNTHRASDRRNSVGLLLPTTPSTKSLNQFQKWWPVTALNFWRILMFFGNNPRLIIFLSLRAFQRYQARVNRTSDEKVMGV